MKGPLPEHAAHWPAVLSSTFHWGQASSVGTLTMDQTVPRAIPPPGLPTATPTCTWASGLGSLDDRPLSQGCNPSSHTHSRALSSPTAVWGATSRARCLPPGKAGNPLTGCPVSSPKMCRSGWFLCVDFSINTSVCSPSVAGRLRVPRADRVGCCVLCEHPRGLVSAGLLEPMPLRCQGTTVLWGTHSYMQIFDCPCQCPNPPESAGEAPECRLKMQVTSFSHCGKNLENILYVSE